MDILRLTLESMTYQGSGWTLAELLQVLKIKTGMLRKAQAVDLLYKFYSNPDSADILYQRLSKYEKALLTCIVHSEYYPLTEDIKAIAEKFQFEKNIRDYYYTFRSDYKDRYFPKGSALYGFFIGNEVPQIFMDYLERTIPPYVHVFNSCEVDDIDKYAGIIDRQFRYKDFDMLLSFINNNKVAATKAGGYMNKTALLKYNAIAGYNDLCNNESGELKDIRNTGETIVSFGLIQLLRCADVIDIIKDKFVLSKNATQFAGLSMPEKAKFLFAAYISRKNRITDECARIVAARLKFLKSVFDLSGPRNEIISYLKECPANEWIDFRVFSKELYWTNKNLFAATGGALIRDDYYNQYINGASWNSCEKNAISVVLMEYLATLGAVDILAERVSFSDYDYYSGYVTSYFRITDLGLYLFGVVSSYKEKEFAGYSADEKGFIVQPNFDVVIPNGKSRMMHELFFDRFAVKTVNDREVSVYSLDFKGMVKALNIGLTIRDICSYCENFSSVPLPANVETAFSEWEKQSGRIRIRTFTAIEADDPFLLEEIKNYKGMNTISEDGLATVLVLSPDAEKKAKSLIERNKRFCVIGG